MNANADQRSNLEAPEARGRCRLSGIVAGAGLVVVASVSLALGASSSAEEAPTPTPLKAKPTVLADGLSVPWGMDFLPGGAALVTERSTGKIFRVPRQGGKPKQVMNVPGVNTNSGEGGLLGLALSPRYERDKLVYAYMTTKRDNRIVRFKLGGKVRPILTGIERANIHNGGRIAFGPDGLLYAGVGDAGNTNLSQNRDSLNGKILRIEPNGGIPKTNPFDSPVFSMGHRNVQGLAFDRQGRLWATEFGQNTRDEVNLIRSGGNYGWPIVEGRGDTDGGRFTNPQVSWTPAEASPSGAAIRGSTLYVAALRGERLWRIPLKGAKAGEPKPRLKGRFGRLRTVEVAPGGALWLATSNDDGNDKVIRYLSGKRR